MSVPDVVPLTPRCGGRGRVTVLEEKIDHRTNVIFQELDINEKNDTVMCK